MDINPQHRERLREVRERAADAQKRENQARELVAVTNGDDTARAAATRMAEDARGDRETARALENQLLRQMSGVSGASFGSESFLSNPETVRQLEALAHSSMPIGSMALGPASTAEEVVAQIQSGQWGSPRLATVTEPSLPDTARQQVYYGIVPQLRRRLSLLDLIPSGTMTGRSFDYTREGGSLTTALETPEAAVKPEADVVLTDAQVIARTIAHWTKLRRQQLADVPALGTTIQTRLSYGIRRRLEDQIVAGDGAGENLLGILNTTGIASVAYAAGTPGADLSLTGITDVLLSYAEPNAVVLNPVDWRNMLVAKASGSGEYLSESGPFGVNPDVLWGLPVIPSTVMPVGQALVGDFAAGATVFVREGVNVRISDSDQDDFVRNALTVLAEGRFGLAIWNPTAFAVVHLA